MLLFVLAHLLLEHVAQGGQPGLGARTVLVFETPAKNTTLSQRIEAHKALIRSQLAVTD